MAKFMRNDAGKDDPYERHIASAISSAM